MPPMTRVKVALVRRMRQAFAETAVAAAPRVND